MEYHYYYISHDNELTEFLQKSISFHLEPFPYEHKNDDYFVLFIIEPIVINEIYYTISNLWLNYLKKFYKNSIPVITGITSCKNQHNCLNLSNLPDNWIQFIDNCLLAGDSDFTVFTNPLGYSEFSLTLINNLRGHSDLMFNKNRLARQINKLSAHKQGKIKLENENEAICELKDRFNTFVIDWTENYKHLKYTPLHSIMQKTNNEIANLKTTIRELELELITLVKEQFNSIAKEIDTITQVYAK